MNNPFTNYDNQHPCRILKKTAAWEQCSFMFSALVFTVLNRTWPQNDTPHMSDIAPFFSPFLIYRSAGHRYPPPPHSHPLSELYTHISLGHKTVSQDLLKMGSREKPRNNLLHM